MLHIAICDDEQDFVLHLQELLNRYAEEAGVEMRISVYHDGMELIEAYNATIDLILLDIQMKWVDGLQTAERVRRMDEKVGIMFLTTLSQYGLEGYKYQAASYMVKPIRYVRLKAEMDRWLERHRQEDSPYILVGNDTGRYKIFLKNLRYVETFNRNLLLHTEQENIICYKSMKNMEQELEGKGFVRCHTSYIVNLLYVKGVEKLEIQLITGEVLPVSQLKRKTFMESLTEYWGSRL